MLFHRAADELRYNVATCRIHYIYRWRITGNPLYWIDLCWVNRNPMSWDVCRGHKVSIGQWWSWSCFFFFYRPPFTSINYTYK